MKNKKVILPIVMLLLLVIVTIGVTFAKEGKVENTLETPTIILTYTEGKTGITLSEAYQPLIKRKKF